MEVVRVLNIVVLVAVIVPSMMFLRKFRAARGYGDVATMLRWQTTSIVLLVLGPLLVNLLNLFEPLTTTPSEQFWTLATRVFAFAGSALQLHLWHKLRKIPLEQMRRRKDDE